MKINKNNFEDVMYDLIQGYMHESVDAFLEAVGEVFNLRTHKWSVFPDDNAPIGDVSEYVVWTDNGYEIFDITLDSYDNIGHVECIYEILRVELNL